MNVIYTTEVEDIDESHFADGFFADWPNPPAKATHARLLRQSDACVLAIHEETGQVVGFITAITDGVLSAYIPFLEVVEPYRSQGIGTKLVQRMLELLDDYYMVDILCDPPLQPWYARFGLRPATGMFRRSYRNQAGRPG